MMHKSAWLYVEAACQGNLYETLLHAACIFGALVTRPHAAACGLLDIHQTCLSLWGVEAAADTAGAVHR